MENGVTYEHIAKYLKHEFIAQNDKQRQFRNTFKADICDTGCEDIRFYVQEFETSFDRFCELQIHQYDWYEVDDLQRTVQVHHFSLFQRINHIIFSLEDINIRTS